MKQSIQETSARSLFSRCAKKATACVLSAVLLLACCPLALAAEHDPDPLTAQELAQMTNEQIAALSQEQSDATLNKMAQLFQDGEKQALDEYLSALGFATTYEEYADQQGWNEEEQPDTEPSIQPMWQSDYDGKEPDKQCHETLTGYGFLMYIGAMNQLFGIAGSFGYTLSEMQLLMTESAWPDKWDIGVLFDCHFYDPDSGTNWRGSSITTARDSAIFYYQQAISNYKSGDRNTAIKSLAHCIHYVQDVGEPHHSSNAISFIGDPYNHSGFEQLASQMLLEEDCLSQINMEYDINYYNAKINQHIGSLVHEIASFSKPFYPMASDKDNVNGQRFILYFLLSYSARDTSGVLYKFAKRSV